LELAPLRLVECPDFPLANDFEDDAVLLFDDGASVLVGRVAETGLRAVASAFECLLAGRAVAPAPANTPAAMNPITQAAGAIFARNPNLTLPYLLFRSRRCNIQRFK
jgi:hypothetical protein